MLKKIEKGAFENCFGDWLREVVIPSSVREIGEDAFANTRIEKLVFSVGMQCLEPNDIITIGDGAFSGCYFDKIHIPCNVGKIGVRAFAGTDGNDSLTSISVSSSNPYYVSVNNCCLSHDSTILEFGCRTSVIPEGVKEIRPYAFYYRCLEKIVIPAGIVKIGKYSFFGCGQYRCAMDVVIPSSVREIGEYAFMYAELKSLTILDGVQTIHKEAFSCCDELTRVEIPQSLKDLGDRVFQNTQSMERIIIHVPCWKEMLIKLSDPYSFSYVIMTEMTEIIFVVQSIEITAEIVETVMLGTHLFGEKRIILEVPIGTGHTYRHYPAFEGKLKEVIADLDV